MGILKDCIDNKKVNTVPIWLMRQAGRYLPEFREIRSKNPNFMELCLNPKLSKEITLQPLKRFSLDAAIVFSDILILPYAMGQEVEFKKDFGPKLGDLNINEVLNVSDSDILKKINPIYELIKITSKDKILEGKDLIGFVGATWTIFIYMLNKQSPRNLNKDLYNYKNQDELIKKIIHVQKLHIKNQVESGASIIQIFDSWAGLVEEKNLESFIYKPTSEIVNFVKSLNVPVVCFPREIKDYKKFVEIVKPDVVNIDYNVDPKNILKNIKIPVQGGLDPKILLGSRDILKKKVTEYMEIFKDHPYIFNLGHGVLPETRPETVDYLVKMVKDY